MKNGITCLLLLALLILPGKPVMADDNFNNDQALKGISEAHIYFDVTSYYFSDINICLT